MHSRHHTKTNGAKAQNNGDITSPMNKCLQHIYTDKRSDLNANQFDFIIHDLQRLLNDHFCYAYTLNRILTLKITTIDGLSEPKRTTPPTHHITEMATLMNACTVKSPLGVNAQ